jgi:hypothetical protein
MKEDNFELKRIRSNEEYAIETENEIQKQNAIQLRRNSVQSKRENS